MTSTDARPRTPSVSELQAALLAARQGAFAGGPATTVAIDGGGIYQATDDHHVDTVAPVVAPARAAEPRRQSPVATSAPAGGRGTWLLGVHGGAGATSLASVLPGTRASAGTWPAASDIGSRNQVVLVCRSSQRGLSAAQEFARQCRDLQLRTHLDLLGVIINADAPGRLPPPLRRLQRLLSGATPVLGEVPWQPAWRLGQVRPFDETPAWLIKLRQAMTTAVPR